MPVINVQILAGSSAEARTRIAHGVTDALRLVVPAPPESFTVVISEVERDNYMRGGAARRRISELPDPRDVVRRFFASMLDGDFQSAEDLLAEDCVFHLPNNVQLRRPHEMMEWSGQNWSQFTSSFEGIDMCSGPEGAVVYARHRVSGVARNGAKIENLLYISRLEFRGPLICKIEHTSNVSLFTPGLG